MPHPKYPGFICVGRRLKPVGVNPICIEPGSRWENGHVESSNGKLRDEMPSAEIFYTPREARVIIERWREE